MPFDSINWNNNGVRPHFNITGLHTLQNKSRKIS
jgi:hypothetical protein